MDSKIRPRLRRGTGIRVHPLWKSMESGRVKHRVSDLKIVGVGCPLFDLDFVRPRSPFPCSDNFPANFGSVYAFQKLRTLVIPMSPDPFFQTDTVGSPSYVMRMSSENFLQMDQVESPRLMFHCFGPVLRRSRSSPRERPGLFSGFP